MNQQHIKQPNPKDPHMIVAGENDFNQIEVDSENNFNLNNPNPIFVSPPLKLPFRNSPYLSYSVYNTHSVVVKNDGTAYAIGDNRKKQIHGSLPSTIKTWTKISIKNKLDYDMPFISAVCGKEYTLYQLQDSNHHILAYVHLEENNGIPLLLNTDNRTILGLFGGRTNAAAIDENGCIVIITQLIFRSKDKAPHILSLPDNEKAIQVACLHKEYIALSSNGNLYKLNLQNNYNLLVFQNIDLPRKTIFRQVAGTWEHFLALSNDGKVFGMGKNQFGHLGIDKNRHSVEVLQQIKNFDSYNVKGIYAGSFHSLALCSNGEVLACGQNKKGELMLKSTSKNFVPIPTQTILNEGASFCIAGFKLSVAFVYCQPPPNIPNKIIDYSTLTTLPTPPPTKNESELIAELGSLLTKFYEQYEQQSQKIEKIETSTKKLANNLNICEKKIEKFKQNMNKSETKNKESNLKENKDIGNVVDDDDDDDDNQFKEEYEYADDDYSEGNDNDNNINKITIRNDDDDDLSN